MPKRKAFSIEEKLDIVRKIECGAKIKDVSDELGLALTTVSTIWSQRTKIVAASQCESRERKKLRGATFNDLDSALLKWFTQARCDNVPVSGPLLKGKAEELAQLLAIEDFKCSNGWLDRFKKRHNINWGRVSGEARDTDLTICDEWLLNEWPKIREGYADCDVFNADETGLFYKLLPDQTLKFKNEKCVGGKLSKERLTVFVCANMDGSEKRKLLVIGKSLKPRCFKNVKCLPVRYQANKKAWMTSVLFEEELRLWDTELLKKKTGKSS